MKAVKAWLEIQTRELVKHNDLMMTQNELMAKQVEYTRQLAISTRRIDEFNRKAFEAANGMGVPEAKEDETVFQELQEQQAGEREAYDEMYFDNISPSGFEDS